MTGPFERNPMSPNEQASRVKAVRAYLDGIGSPISSVQGYEVLARSLGFKSKHVLASAGGAALSAPVVAPAPAVFNVDGKHIPVMALTDEPFSVARMRELGWTFDVIVPFALDQLDSTDSMNDYASQRITGNEAALEDITYNHVPEVIYGKGWVAYRITGYVSSPEDLFEEEAQNQEAQFYLDLRELADRIKGNTEVTIVDRGHASEQLLWRITAESRRLLQVYAATQGKNNDAVNRSGAEFVFETRARKRGSALEVLLAVRLMDLKYARKVAQDTFEFDFEGRLITLRFDD